MISIISLLFTTLAVTQITANPVGSALALGALSGGGSSVTDVLALNALGRGGTSATDVLALGALSGGPYGGLGASALGGLPAALALGGLGSGGGAYPTGGYPLGPQISVPPQGIPYGRFGYPGGQPPIIVSDKGSGFNDLTSLLPLLLLLRC